MIEKKRYTIKVPSNKLLSKKQKKKEKSATNLAPFKDKLESQLCVNLTEKLCTSLQYQ